MLVLACLWATPACSQEAAPPAGSGEAAAVPNLTGFWSGSWSSCTNGHNGPMSARFCPIDASHYQVHFTGRFFRLIPFNYTAVLTVTGTENGRVLLSGSHHLGPLLGTFSYNAWATDTQFVAGYCSHKDQGQFVMNRCSY
jgi:hypothetical protein